MRYSYHHPKTEVRGSEKEGRGLFATGPIAQGEVVIATGGQILPFESLLSHELPGHPIQVETHLVLSPMDSKALDGIFVVNHSCAPNLGMSAQVSLVALRPIKAGEELCYDYAMTDSDPAGKETFGMDCLCRTPECRKRVTDLDWRREDLQRKYEGHFASYLQARIDAL
jgi:SET domain-containing protein